MEMKVESKDKATFNPLPPWPTPLRFEWQENLIDESLFDIIHIYIFDIWVS